MKVQNLYLSQYALDKIKEMIEGKDLDITTTFGDMLQLPYEDESFNGVLAYHSIAHTDTKGLKQVIAEIKRVLKGEGEVLLTLPAKHQKSYLSPSNEKIDDNTIMVTEGFEKGIPHVYVSYDEIQGFLEGFQVLKIRCIEYSNSEGKDGHFYVHAKKL